MNQPRVTKVLRMVQELYMQIVILSKESLSRKSPLQISTRLANIAYKMLTFLQISLNCKFPWILIEMLQSWLCIGAFSTLGMEGKLIIQLQWWQAIPFMNTRWIKMFWRWQYGYKIHWAVPILSILFVLKKFIHCSKNWSRWRYSDRKNKIQTRTLREQIKETPG